ncbi:MAG: peptidoglycan DD-metalloendopeptidase family protein [Ignavibacteriota bacterium]
MKVIIGVVALVVVGIVVGMFAMSTHTELTVSPVSVVGVSTPVTVRVANPHGVRAVEAWVEQDGKRYPVFSESLPSRHLFWKRHEQPLRVTFEAGKTKVPDLKEGKARLIVETTSNDLRGSTDSAAADLTVVLKPPSVMADGFQHYINQGGMELVVITPGGSWNETGVHVGKYSFRSFPMPGHPDQRFSMFAYPWDLSADVVPEVFARNQAGTEATARFMFKLFPKKFRARDFPVEDALMEKLVNSVDPTNTLAPGKDLLGRFLYINGDLRKKNNQQLADLRLKTEEKILWNGPFLHWGKEEADYADVRTYIYHKERVDQQVHLGFDLSDTQTTPVKAANDGKVVWAADLGIYGNCIVVDHGYGLQSIYGHLREIDVKVGDAMQKGQKMGVEGQTGLAGGTHLHFSMQVDGVQVNPREWWDEHWIRDRVMSKLAPDQNAPPASETATGSEPPHKRAKHHKR